MTNRDDTMRIRLSGDRRERTLRSVGAFLDEELDIQMSAFNLERLLDFFVRELGPPVYNQAIKDAHAFMLQKLEDLEGDFYEPETHYGR